MGGTGHSNVREVNKGGTHAHMSEVGRRGNVEVNTQLRGNNSR